MWGLLCGTHVGAGAGRTEVPLERHLFHPTGVEEPEFRHVMQHAQCLGRAIERICRSEVCWEQSISVFILWFHLVSNVVAKPGPQMCCVRTGARRPEITLVRNGPNSDLHVSIALSQALRQNQQADRSRLVVQQKYFPSSDSNEHHTENTHLF